MRDQLHLQYDEDDHSVCLAVVCFETGRHERESVQLRPGFAMDDFRQALLATPWIREVAGELYLEPGVRCDEVVGIVERMFDYFDSPSEPRAALRAVQEAYEEFVGARPNESGVPLMALAWLDLQLREDLADEARSAMDIWTDPAIVIELPHHCHRRLEELCQRFSGRADLRMSPSKRARRNGESGESRTG